MSQTRIATHAGDWYTADANQLQSQLSRWLGAVQPSDSFPIQGSKAIIAPHAGYSYSGPTAAWAYKAIDTTGIKRVFLLGPSHHVYLEKCALPSCTVYETPIGDLPLDLETISELQKSGMFSRFSKSQEEDEHSLEMHLPYIRKVFEGIDIQIVPIVVGNISQSVEANYGKILAAYLARDDTFFVISSDFCHWGTRFRYTYYYAEPAPSKTPGFSLSRSTQPSQEHPVHQSISKLDREAMDILTIPPGTAAEAHADFSTYLHTTANTICGRHPIGVLLGALAALEKESEGKKARLQWVRYEQSSACLTIRDSSVSYASAWVKI